MKVFVTGATGFLGGAIIKDLLSEAYEVKALVRQSSKVLPLVVEQVVVGDLANLKLSDSGSLSRNLTGIEVVVHTAARVHIMNDDAFDPLAEFRKVNRDATLVLARLAAQSGVKRFVFLSSIKVNGEITRPDNPFTPDDEYIPNEPYGLSKYEAEQGLLALAKETGMEVVIIRPPLIYGPGVGGNFLSMIKWMTRPVPLPFGAIYNKRSLVALDNLVSFISLCVDRKKSLKAVNQVLLISDGQDVSTSQLLKKVRQALNCHSNSVMKALLVPFPVNILMFIARVIGKGDMANRLFGSLQVDSSKIRDLLGWQPVVTMDEQLEKISKEIYKR